MRHGFCNLKPSIDECRQRSWENKHFSRVARLVWNIRLRKTFIYNCHKMIQRSCYFQTACCFGRKNRKTQPLLESKIRAGIKTFITVRLVSYKRSFVCLRSESSPVDCKLWSSLKYFKIRQIFLAEKGLGIVLWKNDRISTPRILLFQIQIS
jgi:hypothetical protein